MEKADKVVLNISQEDFTEILTDIFERGKRAAKADKRPTKEEILAIKDRDKRQKAIADNLDLF